MKKSENLDNIEFEDVPKENSVLKKFVTEKSKPLTYEQLIVMYEHIGVNLEDHPILKEKVLKLKAEAEKKKKNV